MNSLSKNGPLNPKAAALTLAALLCAAAAGAKMMEDTVATVGGTPILMSEFEKEVATSMDYWAKTEPDAMRDPANRQKLRESTLEELINREVLFQEGTKQKIHVRDRDIDNGIQEIKDRFKHDESGKEVSDAESEEIFQKQLKSDGLTYEQFRERLSKQIMARKLIDQEVKGKVVPPDDGEIKAYFEKIRTFISSKSSDTAKPAEKGTDPADALLVGASTDVLKGLTEEEAFAFKQISGQVKAATSERVRVSRILVKISPNASENEKKRALKTAQDIRDQLVNGTSTFADIARAVSEDPESAARGGDIGYVLRGVSPPEFERVAFSIQVGDISDPILTEIGYNLIRVQEKRAAETPEFDHFKDELGKAMMNMKFQKDLEAFIKSLKDKAVIERSPSALQ
jgi:peptidyl-prolyl cis-trans isomerase D